MSLSRIFKVLSLSVLVLMGNAGASSSSSLEEADNLSEYSLRRYLATAQSLVAVLEPMVKDDQREDLKALKEKLNDWQQSVDYLLKFEKDKRIYKNADQKRAIHLNRLEQGPNPILYKPRSNIRMGYVHGSEDFDAYPVGFTLFFGEIDPGCLYSRRTIVSGHIPFNNFFRCREEGDLRKILGAHAYGVPFPKGQQPEFYDEQASLEVRQFLYHTRNLETFFTKGEVLPQHSDFRTAYQSVMKTFFNVMGSQYTADVKKNVPVTSPEEQELSWKHWQNEHRNIFDASENSPYRIFVQTFPSLKILSQFTPYTTKF